MQKPSDPMRRPSSPLPARLAPAIALWLLCAQLGCSSTAPDAGTPTEGSAPAAPSSGGEETEQPETISNWRQAPDISIHMQANFLAAIDARDAVIDGDLVRAIEAFHWLAGQQDVGSVSEQWRTLSDKMRATARAGAQATSLQDAAQRVAQLASSCGDCHQHFAAGDDRAPEEDQGFPPVGPEHVETRMVRHQWAADELWYGLVIPSPLTWQGGAKILIGAPEAPPRNPDGSAAPALAPLMDELRGLGQRAMEADTTEARVRAYGDLLGRCTGCHSSRPPRQR